MPYLALRTQVPTVPVNAVPVPTALPAANKIMAEVLLSSGMFCAPNIIAVPAIK